MPSSTKQNRMKGGITSEGLLDWQDASSGCHMWRIDNFSGLTQNYCFCSDVFMIGGCKWRISIFPKGNNSDNFAIYLAVPDAATLPAGWSRKANFTLSMVNENGGSFFIKQGTLHEFNTQEPDWGCQTMFQLRSDLQTRRNGFPVNDTVIVKAEIHLLSVAPPIVFPPIDLPDRQPPSVGRPLVIGDRAAEANDPPTVAPPVVDAPRILEIDRFDSFFTKLEEFIVTAETKEGSSPNNDGNHQVEDLISGSPSLAKVEEAKISMKQCLSETFNLYMKDRLAAALLTLNHAEFGLSSDQRKSVKAFWENFDNFISGFLMFEQSNSEFELQKLGMDQMFSAMKRNHETHLLNKQLQEALNKEEKELKKRMDDVQVRKEKLISDWESMVARSEELKSTYATQEKKLVEAEEKKRIAEERMSISTAAWSSLKAQFLGSPFESKEGYQYPTVSSSLSQKAHEGTEYPNVTPSLQYVLNRQPNPWPIKYRGIQNLTDILDHSNQTMDTLYYEVLDIPLPELEVLKNLRIAFRLERKGQVVIHNIWLPKQSTVQDVLNELKKKVQLSHPDAELRLLEIYYHKINKIFPLGDKIDNIHDQHWTLRAEEIPEEEKNLSPRDHVIQAYHFLKEIAEDQRQLVVKFGEPFFLVIHEGETLAEVKARLQKKMQVPLEDFTKWRFVVASLGRPEYVDDSEILWRRFKREDSLEAWEQCLGLEHSESQEVVYGG